MLRSFTRTCALFSYDHACSISILMRKSHRDCLKSARSLWIHSLCSPSDRTCTRLHTEFKRTCLSSGSVHSILLAREYRNEWEAQKQPIAELFIRFVVWIFAIYCIQLQILSIQLELFCRGESGLRKRCFPKVINPEPRALSGQDVIMKSPKSADPRMRCVAFLP